MKKALIVWGGWHGHEPEQGSQIVRDILQNNGFEVRVETQTAAFVDPALAQLDLIVPIYTMSKIEKEECANLTAAVRSGVGLAGFHGGMCDSFRDSVEYQFMTGGQWVAHPGNDGRHYRVAIVDANPITEGITDFDVISEKYYLHVDPAMRVKVIGFRQHGTRPHDPPLQEPTPESLAAAAEILRSVADLQVTVI